MNINTIFYFADTLPFDQYKAYFNAGEISPSTIVFVKDSKDIYMGGTQYGSMSIEDLKEKMTTIFRENQYVLPIATRAKLGGVVVGGYLDINENTGVLSVNIDELFSNRSVLEIIKNFTEYDDTEVRELIARLEQLMNELRQTLEDRMDEFDHDLDELSTLANDQKTRLSELIAALDISIQNKVESMLEDAQWIQENWPQGVTNWQSGWNSDIEAYLTQVGVWARNGDITKTQWTSIIQKVDNLELSVNSIKSQDTQSFSDALQAMIQLAIDDEVASLELGTTYAKINDINKVIEWMYSGLKSSSSSSLTYNLIVSAAKNDTLGASAISELRTSIENLGDTYVAKTEMNTMVGNSLASIVEQVSPGSSFTAIINQVGTNTNNISSITSRVGTLENGHFISESEMLNCLENELDGTTTKSSIKSKVDDNAKTAAYSLFASVATNNTDKTITALSIVDSIVGTNAAMTTLGAYFKLKSENPDEGLTESEVETIVETKLNASATGGSWTSYVNSINGAISATSTLDARVQTLENGDFVSSTNIGSIIQDKIGNSTSWAGLATTTYVDSASAELSASLSTKANDSEVVKKASVIASINESGESNVKISADKINIAGVQISGDLITAGTISANRIDTANLYIAAANITGKLTANLINATDLHVSAANIDGTLTASLIDATNLAVAAANITGTLTANQIDVDGITIDGSQVTGIDTLIADYIDANDIYANSLHINNGRPAGYGSTNWTVDIDDTHGILMSTLYGNATSDEFQIVDNTVLLTHNNNTAIRFNKDGSGFLAYENIKWDNLGQISKITVKNYHLENSSSPVVTYDSNGNEIVSFAATESLADFNKVEITPGIISLGGNFESTIYIDATEGKIEIAPLLQTGGEEPVSTVIGERSISTKTVNSTNVYTTSIEASSIDSTTDITLYGDSLVSVSSIVPGDSSVAQLYSGVNVAYKIGDYYVIVLKGIIVYMSKTNPYNNSNFATALASLGNPRFEEALG